MNQRATAFFVILFAAAGAACASGVAIRSEVTRTRLPIARIAPGSPAELVLRDIRYENHPGTQFHVVLERRDDRTKRARVGTLSFYTATKTRTFDITDELRQIAASRADLEKIDVVFEATSGANGRVRVDPRMKVTIGKVELRGK